MRSFKRCAQESARRRHRRRPRARARRRGRKCGHDGADEDAAEAGRQGCPVHEGRQGSTGPEGRQRPEGQARCLPVRRVPAARPVRAGPAGPPGPAGPQGPAGAAGEDAPEEYGVAYVRVQRGDSAPQSVWATYSTELGSPVGDTTSGTFRFTCNAAQAPCRVSVVAKLLSDTSVATGKVYPRVLIYRGGDPDSVVTPEFYCEYGDGPLTIDPADAEGRHDADDGRPGAARHRRLGRLQRSGSDSPVRSPRSWCRRASTTSFSTFVFTTA